MHTSSASFFKAVLRYASKSNFSSTMSFMDFNSFISFIARDSMSCICRCENAIALSEQPWVEQPVLKLGKVREKRGPSRFPLGNEALQFCDFFRICRGFMKTFLWLRTTGSPILSAILECSISDLPEWTFSSWFSNQNFPLHSGKLQTKGGPSKIFETIEETNW